MVFADRTLLSQSLRRTGTAGAIFLFPTFGTVSRQRLTFQPRLPPPQECISLVIHLTPGQLGQGVWIVLT